MNWRQRCVAVLAARPTEWQRLSEVFAAVARDIPMHLAMRYTAGKGYATRRDKLRETRDTALDIGVNTARWRLFLSYIGRLVERRASDGGVPGRRAQRTDLVRLRPHETPCEVCGGLRYLSMWSKPGQHRQYTCASCSKPVIEPLPPPVPQPEPAKRKAKKPKTTAYQRRGTVDKQPIRPVLPPVTALVPVPAKPARPIRPPIAIVVNNHGVIFDDQRAVARDLSKFLKINSINQAEAELAQSGIGIMLLKRGKTVWEFVQRYFWFKPLEHN